MTRTLNLPLSLPLSWSGGGSAYAPSQGGGAQPPASFSFMTDSRGVRMLDANNKYIDIRTAA
jgi:hypothetical protein